MNYQESLDYIMNTARFGKKNGLENICRLLYRLGDPQKRLRCVHVAGTNGKGSVCAMTASVLREAGYKTALFTSPYLERFNERFNIDGEDLSDEKLAELATRVREAADAMEADGQGTATFFELVTAMGFLAFAEAKVDIAVIETGLGGRLDATNVLDSVLTVITAIGLDHTNVLGTTVEEIAREKAGIMKPGVPVVIYPQPYPEAYAELLGTAKALDCPVYTLREATVTSVSSGWQGQVFDLSYQGLQFKDLEIGLVGAHQCLNASTALITCLALRQALDLPLTEAQIRSGLAKARWPGRLEVIGEDPRVLIDGAHNPQGAEVLAATLHQLLPSGNAVLVSGVMATKEARPIARELASFAQMVIATTPPDSPKSLPADEWAECFEGMPLTVMTCDDPWQALETGRAMAKMKGVPLVVAGSLYLAGMTRRVVLGHSEK